MKQQPIDEELRVVTAAQDLASSPFVVRYVKRTDGATFPMNGATVLHELLSGEDLIVVRTPPAEHFNSDLVRGSAFDKAEAFASEICGVPAIVATKILMKLGFTRYARRA